MAKIAEYKKRIVSNIANLISQYPIIATINMENLPAFQLQKMRAELRDKVITIMTKRRLIKIAFEEAKKTKEGVEQLGKYLEGMPALMFTKENPFKLYKILQRSKSPAPAKPNQTAPKDIIVEAGPTSFSPGPIIGELAQAGIKAGVESGKVVIKQDSIVVKKGDKIKPKVAEILTRLGIQPMEVGLDLVAAYENGTIYTKDILAIDEEEFMGKLKSASLGAFNVAMFISYPTRATIKHLISKAANDAKALGLSQNIIDTGIVEVLIGNAERGMLNLKDIANIQVAEKPKVEEKPAEKPKVEEKPKEKEVAETKREKPSIPKPETIEKKEEKILEEEKKILEEEKRLEKQKPAEVPVEREVQEVVKEEEEKQLEKERIEKEKELEKIEQQKAETKKVEDETAKKVAELVAKTKKFGKEPTAKELVEEVKKETKKKEPKPKEKVPTLEELAKRKKQEERKKEMESAEQLLEKLKKKGTLRG